MALQDWLRQVSSTHPNKTALVYEGMRWSYADFDQITDAVADSFRQLGLGRGDRIVFLLPNCPELVFCYYACFKLGAIAVPLNTRLQSAELEYIVNHCGARLCISHASLFPALQAVRSHLPAVERYFLVGDGAAFPNLPPFSALLHPSPSHPAISRSAAPSAPAVILYTSGTTARPKGVTHSHASLESTAQYFIETVGMQSEDVLGGMLPLSHIFGFALQLVVAVSTGATLVLLSNFDPAIVLPILEREWVTKLYGLPVMFNALVHDSAVTLYDLRALQVCFAGGDSVPEPLYQRVKELWGIELVQGCGMTEVLPYCINPPAANRMGSIGPVCSGMQLRLVDGQGQDVAVGEVGEVLVRSEAVMLGYWNNPVATAEILRDGWLYTGDLARCDRDGYYWFVGRSKEIIIRGGSNIAPLEVEAVLYQHPAVREAGVVGVPDPAWGEVVRAYVALKPGQSVTERELHSFLQERLAAYKVPEAIVFLPDLPKGLTGKIHRKTLREWAMQPLAV